MFHNFALFFSIFYSWHESHVMHCIQSWMIISTITTSLEILFGCMSSLLWPKVHRLHSSAEHVILYILYSMCQGRSEKINRRRRRRIWKKKKHNTTVLKIWWECMRWIFSALTVIQKYIEIIPMNAQNKKKLGLPKKCAIGWLCTNCRTEKFGNKTKTVWFNFRMEWNERANASNTKWYTFLSTSLWIEFFDYKQLHDP